MTQWRDRESHVEHNFGQLVQLLVIRSNFANLCVHLVVPPKIKFGALLNAFVLCKRPNEITF